MIKHFFQDYHKALEDADEKVQLANQIHEMVRQVFASAIFHNMASIFVAPRKQG